MPREQLDDEVMADAKRVASNDPFQLRMIKLAINQAQDAQGFTEQIRGVHASYQLAGQAGSDPAAERVKTSGRRLGGVERAFRLREQAERDRADV